MDTICADSSPKLSKKYQKDENNGRSTGNKNTVKREMFADDLFGEFHDLGEKHENI